MRLGYMAVHHDESLHGYFGYQIAIGNEYQHSPLTHGMLLFELIAGAFFLFGDSEFTLRLSMAVFGSALILVPLLMRKQLGDIGALLTSVMLTFSPALFYFSRFRTQRHIDGVVHRVASRRHVALHRREAIPMVLHRRGGLGYGYGDKGDGIHIRRHLRSLLRLDNSV